jgi:hypothetical protein
MWRTAAFEACLATMTRSTAFQTMKCPGLSEGGTKNCAQKGKCQQATLVYKTVPDLATVWDDYKAGLQIVDTKKAVKGAKTEELKYFVSVMASRGPALANYPGEFFVIVYAPKDIKAKSGLGRGHFLMKVGTRPWGALARAAAPALCSTSRAARPSLSYAPAHLRAPTARRAHRPAGPSWVRSKWHVH